MRFEWKKAMNTKLMSIWATSIIHCHFEIGKSMPSSLKQKKKNFRNMNGCRMYKLQLTVFSSSIGFFQSWTSQFQLKNRQLWMSSNSEKAPTHYMQSVHRQTCKRYKVSDETNLDCYTSILKIEKALGILCTYMDELKYGYLVILQHDQ